MSVTLEQLKIQADTLTPEDRAALAEHLLESLEDSTAADADWEAELDRRIEDIRSGREVGIPVEEVLAELRERYP
jgi:putative addiction module component (TIGR02574 family)